MDIREKLVDGVRRYFTGPHEQDESLPDPPEEVYVSGLLFPKNTQQEPEDLELAGKPSKDDTVNSDGSHVTDWLLQNSIGIKCTLKSETKHILVEVEYAKYVHTDEGSWKRIPPTCQKFEIDLDSPSGEKIFETADDILESKVTWISNNDKNGFKYRTLSVFLSNEALYPKKTDNEGKERKYSDIKNERNEKILFQPKIKLMTQGSDDTFLAFNIANEGVTITPEEQSLDLLFRKNQTYAQGYSCGASWDMDSGNPLFVQTEIVPTYDSQNIEFSSDDGISSHKEIDMQEIEHAETPLDIKKILDPMITKYEAWINTTFEKPDLEERYRNAADENHRRCNMALDRMRKGLVLLESDPDVFESFKITNQAMMYQIARYDYAIVRSRGQKISQPDMSLAGKYFWRPFQIAFLLMNLEGISHGGDDREVVDLLWIPTGGGKTEAYLAITAFTLILRRIKNTDKWHTGLGVSVIMRYTLKLLTLQQFERAATLICALEKIRRRGYSKLGKKPFLIGLWVGQGLTPNTAYRSEEAIKNLMRGEDQKKESPAQLNFCPWCGDEIRCDRIRNDYRYDSKTKWTLVSCPNSKCEFHTNRKDDPIRTLPVLTVDHDIYRRCPSLLIATVDKFARLPWNPDTASLFGRVDRLCPTHGFLNHASNHPESSHRGTPEVIVEQTKDRLEPPDLIIQDELHLISGPLGTMVGLYETAVEHLASGSSKPKIIVSTATVRGIENQVRNLYDRKELHTFPPPAMDYGDSFFWRYSKKPGRKYVGLSYSHRSMKFSLAKLYASILLQTTEMKGKVNSTDLDPYWTIVAYFNSTRELGGAIRLTEDDVPNNMKKMSMLSDRTKNYDPPKIHRDELTGRRSGDEIKELRRKLEQSMDSEDSINMLLATNMISVGIDVNRMGLMVLDGQPKNFSEYIQATGRIGRRENVPGLVFSLFNPHKARDLSHYEDYIGSHRMMQKWVEPVGITPFSYKAMERGLHAVFLALVRICVKSLSPNGSARIFDRDNPTVKAIASSIINRCNSAQIRGDLLPDRYGAKEILDQFQDNWKDFIKKYSKIFYLDDSKYNKYNTTQKKEHVIMTDYAGATGIKDEEFLRETPGSLRDVEMEAKLFYE